MNAEILEKFLDYVYTGEVEVTPIPQMRFLGICICNFCEVLFCICLRGSFVLFSFSRLFTKQIKNTLWFSTFWDLVIIIGIIINIVLNLQVGCLHDVWSLLEVSRYPFLLLRSIQQWCKNAGWKISWNVVKLEVSITLPGRKKCSADYFSAKPAHCNVWGSMSIQLWELLLLVALPKAEIIQLKARELYKYTKN